MPLLPPSTFPHWRAYYRARESPFGDLLPLRGYAKFGSPVLSHTEARYELVDTPDLVVLTLNSTGLVKILHQFHVDRATPLHPTRSNDLWALIGDGPVAIPVLFPTTFLAVVSLPVPPEAALHALAGFADVSRLTAARSDKQYRGRKFIILPPFLASLCMEADTDDASLLFMHVWQGLNDFDRVSADSDSASDAEDSDDAASQHTPDAPDSPDDTVAKAAATKPAATKLAAKKHAASKPAADPVTPASSASELFLPVLQFLWLIAAGKIKGYPLEPLTSERATTWAATVTNEDITPSGAASIRQPLGPPNDPLLHTTPQLGPVLQLLADSITTMAERPAPAAKKVNKFVKFPGWTKNTILNASAPPATDEVDANGDPVTIRIKPVDTYSLSDGHKYDITGKRL